MCVTAFAIALVIRIYRAYGTLDVRKIRELRG
jgi:multisubunit Na+/H+ antiporter MnhC subunit